MVLIKVRFFFLIVYIHHFIDPCEDRNCAAQHSTCLSLITGRAQCICPRCVGYYPVYEPICTDDTFSYANQCLMKQKACTSNKPIEFLQQKSCGEYSLDTFCIADKKNKYQNFIATVLFITLMLVHRFRLFNMVKWNACLIW